MHPCPPEATLSALVEERRRQDQEFGALCSALSALDPGQRFRLSAARSAEFAAAWETALPHRAASFHKMPALRA